MKAFLAVVLLAVVANQARARLGETDVQIVARYGQAVNSLQSPSPGVVTRTFRLNGFIIAVAFLKEQSIEEVYSHVGGGSLSDSEIAALLKANSSDGKWEKKKGGNAWELMTNNILTAAATYDSKAGSLKVTQKLQDDMSKF